MVGGASSGANSFWLGNLQNSTLGLHHGHQPDPVTHVYLYGGGSPSQWQQIILKPYPSCCKHEGVQCKKACSDRGTLRRGWAFRGWSVAGPGRSVAGPGALISVCLISLKLPCTLLNKGHILLTLETVRSPAKILSVAIARFGTAMVSKSNVFIIQNSHRQFLATNIVIIWQQLSHPKSALVLVWQKFRWRPPLMAEK